LTDELRASDSDSAFVLRNSEGQNPFMVYRPGDELPQTLLGNVENISVGETYGPFLTNRSTYITHKITEKYEGTPRIRASHILFGVNGLDDAGKESVRATAQNVLTEIQNGLNFASAAAQYGQDGTAQRGGDLGWFAKEDFVTEFAEAAYAAKSTGLINDLVETEYGFHIISVTELPKSETFKIATIELELAPTDATRNDVFRNADSFAANTSNAKEFEANAKEDEYRIIQANGVEPVSRNLNNLQNAREVIRWAFNEATVGNVSQVFELDNSYVVVLLTNKTKEGTASLEQVRQEVTAQLRNEKKASMIVEKLKGKTTLEEMKAVFSDASLDNTSDLRLSVSVLPGVGFAPKAIGAIFGLKNSGDMTKPIHEDIGIVVAKLNNIVTPSEIADYTGFQRQLVMNSSQRASYMVMMALQDLAEVKDYRYKFF
jgi:peptidyl-prolyl cis-trans isomerase D